MPTRRPLHMFWGVVLLITGALLGLVVAHAVYLMVRSPRGYPDFWFIGGLALLGALGAFCAWLSRNELRRAGGEEVKKPKIRWGRMLAGSFLAFNALRSHFAPGPHSLKAANEAEGAGMLTVTIFLVVTGLALIGLAFRPGKPEPLAKAPAGNDSTTGASN